MSRVTPRPWAIRGPAGVDRDFAIVADRKIIAEAWGRVCETDFPDAGANAAHIIKCVNMHDELVEALGSLITEVERLPGMKKNLLDAWDFAKKTLAKAEAE